jgi:hypothetical protein
MEIFRPGASEIPMFRFFGTTESDKHRVVYDTSHNIPRPDLIRESPDWFDKYLGRRNYCPGAGWSGGGSAKADWINSNLSA